MALLFIYHIPVVGSSCRSIVSIPLPRRLLSLSGAVPSKIMARSSRKALDVRGGPSATGDGVPIQQLDYIGTASQQWQLVPICMP